LQDGSSRKFNTLGSGFLGALLVLFGGFLYELIVILCMLLFSFSGSLLSSLFGFYSFFAALAFF
jgi:hypothetical protein